MGITDTTNRNRSYASLVSEALGYWETQSAAHGAYSADYTLRPNASDPDIEVRFVSDIEVCGYASSELAVGCAPILDGDDYQRTTTAVRIEGDLNDSSTVLTLKHEFGHTLGLSHGYNDTLPFMNASVDTSRQPMTDAVNKTNPWGTDSLDVYVNYTGTVHGSERDAYATEVREGLEYWNGGAEGYAPENLTLTVTRNESAADIVVKFADSVDTDDGTGHLVRRGGYDPDGDERLESFTYATVTISERGDEDLIDWNTAAAIGYLLGDTEEGEIAPPFDGDVENSDEWTD